MHMKLRETKDSEKSLIAHALNSTPGSVSYLLYALEQLTSSSLFAHPWSGNYDWADSEYVLWWWHLIMLLSSQELFV